MDVRDLVRGSEGAVARESATAAPATTGGLDAPAAAATAASGTDTHAMATAGVAPAHALHPHLLEYVTSPHLSPVLVVKAKADPSALNHLRRFDSATINETKVCVFEIGLL